MTSRFRCSRISSVAAPRDAPSDLLPLRRSGPRTLGRPDERQPSSQTPLAGTGPTEGRRTEPRASLLGAKDATRGVRRRTEESRSVQESNGPRRDVRAKHGALLVRAMFRVGLGRDLSDLSPRRLYKFLVQLDALFPDLTQMASKAYLRPGARRQQPLLRG